MKRIIGGFILLACVLVACTVVGRANAGHFGGPKVSNRAIESTTGCSGPCTAEATPISQDTMTKRTLASIDHDEAKYRFILNDPASTGQQKANARQQIRAKELQRVGILRPNGTMPSSALSQ